MRSTLPAAGARAAPTAHNLAARRLAGTRAPLPPARAFIEPERRGAGPAGGFANQLEALRSMSVVVADTGEPDLVKAYKPGGRVACVLTRRFARAKKLTRRAAAPACARSRLHGCTRVHPSILPPAATCMASPSLRV